MIKKILCAVDFSDVSESVIEKTKEIAIATESEVLLLHVEPHPEMLHMAFGDKEEIERASNQPGGEEYTLRKLEALFDGSGLKVSHTRKSGEPIKRIIETADNFGADLIAIGSHGHGKLYHALGGGGHRDPIVKESPVPVLVVKNPK